MREIGIDISEHTPTDVRQYLTQEWDYVCLLYTSKIAERVPHIRSVSFSFRQPASEPSFQHLAVGEPVSYPHLDVYKRQTHTNCQLAVAR